MVERDLAKVDTGVQFPSLAPLKSKGLIQLSNFFCGMWNDRLILWQVSIFSLFCFEKIPFNYFSIDICLKAYIINLFT